LENLCNQQRNNNGHSDANIRRSISHFWAFIATANIPNWCKIQLFNSIPSSWHWCIQWHAVMEFVRRSFSLIYAFQLYQKLPNYLLMAPEKHLFTQFHWKNGLKFRFTHHSRNFWIQRAPSTIYSAIVASNFCKHRLFSSTASEFMPRSIDWRSSRWSHTETSNIHTGDNSWLPLITNEKKVEWKLILMISA
jgi:hypothetical protein